MTRGWAYWLSKRMHDDDEGPLSGLGRMHGNMLACARRCRRQPAAQSCQTRRPTWSAA
jgi:hypothetical protein